MKGWLTEYEADQGMGDSDLVIYPFMDDLEHNLAYDSSCTCGVSVEVLSNGRLMFAHAALDGRE